jgi:hypothetical protein
MFFQNISIFALALAGLGALSLAMERHAKQAFGKAPRAPRRHARRSLGAVILLLSLFSSIQAYGASIGAVVFFGICAVASAGIALTFTYRPRLLPYLAYILGAGGVFIALAAQFGFLDGFSS